MDMKNKKHSSMVIILLLHGETQANIAKLMGLSRQRIGQIIKSEGWARHYKKIPKKKFIKIKREGKMFISYCPSLDVYSQGTTYLEAEKNIYEAISLFCDAIKSRQRG